MGDLSKCDHLFSMFCKMLMYRATNRFAICQTNSRCYRHRKEFLNFSIFMRIKIEVLATRHIPPLRANHNSLEARAGRGNSIINLEFKYKPTN